MPVAILPAEIRRYRGHIGRVARDNAGTSRSIPVQSKPVHSLVVGSASLVQSMGSSAGGPLNGVKRTWCDRRDSNSDPRFRRHTPPPSTRGFIAMDSPHLMKMVPLRSWVFNATSTSVRAPFLLSLAQLLELGTCFERFVGIGRSFNGETIVAVSEITVLHQRREITTREAGDSRRLK